MKIDKALRVFAEYLNISWVTVLPLLVDREYTTNEISINDWLQSNWELLVELKVLGLGEYLEIYGEGADLNGSSSRVTDINALATFKIKVGAVNPENTLDFLNNQYVKLDNITFDRIVGFKNEFYFIEPDFKYVLVFDEEFGGIERVFLLDDVIFELIHV
jgi:hypothetical protein